MFLKKAIVYIAFTVLSISSVLGHATINYPTGGESFLPSSQITIKWEEGIDHGPNDWDLFYSFDGGETWTEIALDLSESTFEYIWTVPFAETSNARIKVVQDNNDYVDYDGISVKFSISLNPQNDDPDDDPSVVTGLEDFDGDKIELTNFPNPFRDFTTIQYSIPASGDVVLKVYSIAGKIVLSNSEHPFTAGTHKFVWRNADLPGGIYLCKLTFGDVIINRKMILSP